MPGPDLVHNVQRVPVALAARLLGNTAGSFHEVSCMLNGNRNRVWEDTMPLLAF